MNMKMVIIFDPLYQEIPLLRDPLLRESTVVWQLSFEFLVIAEYSGGHL